MLWFGLVWGQCENLVLLVGLKSERPLPIPVSPPQRHVNRHSLPLLRDSSGVSHSTRNRESDIEDTLGLGPS